MAHLDQLVLDSGVLSLDRVDHYLFRVDDRALVGLFEVPNKIHFLNLRFELFNLRLEVLIFYLFLVEGGLVRDEVGAHQELAVAHHTDVTTWHLAIDSQVRFRVVPLLEATFFAVVRPAKLAENALSVCFEHYFGTGSARFGFLLFLVGPVSHEDRVFVVKVKLLCADSEVVH